MNNYVIDNNGVLEVVTANAPTGDWAANVVGTVNDSLKDKKLKLLNGNYVEDTAAQSVVDATKIYIANLEAAYATMTDEIYNQMYVVFGTKNSESASAYYQTWLDMVASPASYSLSGLKDDLNAALDTDQKVLDFANAKIADAKAFSLFRMQKIQVFKDYKGSL